MIGVRVILLVLALVFFILGTIPVPSRINWVSAGLACWVLSLIVA